MINSLQWKQWINHFHFKVYWFVSSNSFKRFSIWICSVILYSLSLSLKLSRLVGTIRMSREYLTTRMLTVKGRTSQWTSNELIACIRQTADHSQCAFSMLAKCSRSQLDLWPASARRLHMPNDPKKSMCGQDYCSNPLRLISLLTIERVRGSY